MTIEIVEFPIKKWWFSGSLEQWRIWLEQHLELSPHVCWHMGPLLVTMVGGFLYHDKPTFSVGKVVGIPIFDEKWSKALSEMWHKTTWEWSVTWWKMVHWGCQVAIVGRLVFFRDSRSRLQARPHAPVGTILGRRKLLFPSIPSARWSPKASKLDYHWANGHDGYDCWVMSCGFMIR